MAGKINTLKAIETATKILTIKPLIPHLQDEENIFNTDEDHIF